MRKMIETDILIIGAGPVGLFAVFEAGLLKMRCHILDVLPYPGGQLAEIYPKKPIYDIPGYPSVLAGDLVQNLMQQINPFGPGFTLGERAAHLEKHDDGRGVSLPIRYATPCSGDLHSRWTGLLRAAQATDR